MADEMFIVPKKVKSDDYHMVNVRLDKDLFKRVSQLAEDSHESLGNVISFALRYALKRSK